MAISFKVICIKNTKNEGEIVNKINEYFRQAIIRTYKIGKKLKLIIENLPLPSRNCATLTLFVNLIFFSDVTDDWYNTSTLSSKDFRMVLTDQ